MVVGMAWETIRCDGRGDGKQARKIKRKANMGASAGNTTYCGNSLFHNSFQRKMRKRLHGRQATLIADTACTTTATTTTTTTTATTASRWYSRVAGGCSRGRLPHKFQQDGRRKVQARFDRQLSAPVRRKTEQGTLRYARAAASGEGGACDLI